MGEIEAHGKPMFEVSVEKQDGSTYPFVMGIKKAQAIVEHIDELKAYVAKNTEVRATKGAPF